MLLIKILIGLSNICGVDLKYRDDLVKKGLMRILVKAASIALKQEEFPKDLARNPTDPNSTIFTAPFIHSDIREALVWLISNITTAPFEICTTPEVTLC
jgi:hypothetical protein